MSARQKNAPKGGENFKVQTGKGDGQAGKGSVSRVIGPMSATTKIKGGSPADAVHVGPQGAPYINKNSY